MPVWTSWRIGSDPWRWMKTGLSPGGPWHLCCLHRIGYPDCLTAGALRMTHSPEGP